MKLAYTEYHRNYITQVKLPNKIELACNAEDGRLDATTLSYNLTLKLFYHFKSLKASFFIFNIEILYFETSN
ncbi:hypothetical protein AFK68_23260 [Hydrocoleum sp. CS-953]|nr:hypothetical protein AFK68_23260 [Hydrocoleum sp. CS-953]